MRKLFAVLALVLLPAAFAQAQNGYCYAMKPAQSPSPSSRTFPCRVSSTGAANFVITWGAVKHVVRPSTVNDNLILDGQVASQFWLWKDDFKAVPYEYLADAEEGHLVIHCFRNARETLCYALP